MLGENLLQTFGFYPNKKQKTMAPVPSKKYVRGKSRSKIYKKSVGKSKNLIKKTILSMADTKVHCQNDSALAQNMTMNNIYTANISGKIGFGTAENQRVGDEIYLMGLRIKGNFLTDTASNCYQYRLIVGYTGEEYNPTNFGSSAAGTGLSAAEIFHPTTGGNYLTSAPVNPKAFTALYDETVDMNSQLTATSDIYGIDVYVPLRKKFPFQAGGAFLGKFKNLVVVVVSTVGRSGTPLTTASGSVNLSTAVLFKNF